MDFQKDSKQDAGHLLQFQDFGSEVPTADSLLPSSEETHNFSKFPASHIDIEEDQAKEEGEDAAGGASMLSWGYYQRYFDVDTPQVKERLMWSFIPRPAKNTLAHFIRPSPDLYGPFWVCVTLIFCIAIMGNIADYLHSGGEGQHWRYDFRKVSISATSIFSYALLLPLLLWLFLWWRKNQGEQLSIGLIEIVCLYGYSLAIYIPISVLWTIPFAWIQWSLVIIGAALSGSVLILSLWDSLSASPRGLVFAVLAAVLFCHFLLAAGLQLYFFRYSDQVVIDPVTALNPTPPVDHLPPTLTSLNLVHIEKNPIVSTIATRDDPAVLFNVSSINSTFAAMIMNATSGLDQ